MSEVPDGWERRTIGEMLRMRYGKALPAPERDEDGPHAVYGSAGRMTATGVALVSEPVVIIGRKGNVGSVTFDSEGCWPIDTTYYATIPSGLDPKFLFHQLCALELKRLDSSTATPSLRREDLEAQPLLLPPLDEQRRIVAILEDHLSRLDAADSSLSAIARLSPLFARSGTHSALTSVPVEWRPLSAVLDGIEAGKSFTCLPRTSEKGEWGVIKVSAMTWGEFRPEENKAVPPGKGIDERFQIRRGDILVSRANTEHYVGAPVIVREQPDRLLLSDKSLRLLLAAGVDREWLIAALQGPSTRRQISALATGTKDSMRNISQGALMSVEVPVPIHEVDQQTVTNAVTVCREAVEHLDSARTGLNRRRDALRRSLLAAAFSGQLTKEFNGV